MLLLFAVIHSCSYVWLVVTPGTVACQASLSFTGLLKFISIELWCYPTISPTVVPFCYCLLFVLTSVSFPTSQLFTWGGQSIGTVASVLPMNIQDWFPLGLIIWSPCSPRDSQEFSPSPQFKGINSLVFSLFYGPTITFIQTTGRFDRMDLYQQSNFSAL